MPISRQARSTRTAISPLLATRIFMRTVGGPPAEIAGGEAVVPDLEGEDDPGERALQCLDDLELVRVEQEDDAAPDRDRKQADHRRLAPGDIGHREEL
jgi:hypothetical protein